jgi:hypothetical protein
LISLTNYVRAPREPMAFDAEVLDAVQSELTFLSRRVANLSEVLRRLTTKQELDA